MTVTQEKYFDLTPTFGIPCSKSGIPNPRGEDPGVTWPREFTITPGGERGGEESLSCAGNFPLKDLQGPPGMVVTSVGECVGFRGGETQFTALPSPIFLSLFLSPLSELLLSLPCTLIPLLSLSPSNPPAPLCWWSPCRAFSSNRRGWASVKSSRCEPERILLCDDRSRAKIHLSEALTISLSFSLAGVARGLFLSGEK